jgi:hypothetical protein
VFVTSKFFQAGLIFVSKAVAYTSGAGYLLLPKIIDLPEQTCPETNTLAYLAAPSATNEESFCDVDTW